MNVSLETLVLDGGVEDKGERGEERDSSIHIGWRDEKHNGRHLSRPLFIHPLELACAVHVSMDGRQPPRATCRGSQSWCP